MPPEESGHRPVENLHSLHQGTVSRADRITEMQDAVFGEEGCPPNETGVSHALVNCFC